MDLRYPIGNFQPPAGMSEAQRRNVIEGLVAAPASVRAAVRGLNEAQLDTPYRDGGWTVRQVVHHLADSHLNAYVRCRLAVTEPEPTIKPYDENLWAALEDARTAPVETSLVMLEALHDRWTRLLRSLRQADFLRALRHPEHGRVTLDWAISLYEWHGRHHIAHITGLRERKGWS